MRGDERECFDAPSGGYSSVVIEIREERADWASSAVVIRCGESAEAVGVVRCVDLALRLGPTRLVVDLGERDAADADFLSVLYGCGQRVRDAGGSLSVVCADARLRRLFDVTLLSESLPVYETEEDALAA